MNNNYNSMADPNVVNSRFPANIDWRNIKTQPTMTNDYGALETLGNVKDILTKYKASVYIADDGDVCFTIAIDTFSINCICFRNNAIAVYGGIAYYGNTMTGYSKFIVPNNTISKFVLKEKSKKKLVETLDNFIDGSIKNFKEVYNK